MGSSRQRRRNADPLRERAGRRSPPTTNAVHIPGFWVAELPRPEDRCTRPATADRRATAGRADARAADRAAGPRDEETHAVPAMSMYMTRAPPRYPGGPLLRPTRSQ